MTYLFNMFILFITEIIHESGHVFAAFSDDIPVKYISHDIYVGFFTVSNTQYDVENVENKYFMSYMRLFSAGITNNIISIIVCLVLKYFTKSSFLQYVYRTVILFSAMSAFSNSLSCFDFDGHNIANVISHKIGNYLNRNCDDYLLKYQIVIHSIVMASVCHNLYYCS